MVMMANPKDKKKAGRPKGKVTLAVEKAYNDYEGKDAGYDVPRIVHQEHPEISLKAARNKFWASYRQHKSKMKKGKSK